MEQHERLADFLFETGTMRRLPRMHRQTLLIDDTSDTIASHSYRVALIGWHLAKLEEADPYKVVMMCLLHDMGEIRSNDHNWVHKRYVKIYEEEITKDQLGSLPFTDLYTFATEYMARETVEAKLAKEADILDQILLLREYEWQGSQEAKSWLETKSKDIARLQSEGAKALGHALLERSPSDWWQDIWTNQNR